MELAKRIKSRPHGERETKQLASSSGKVSVTLLEGARNAAGRGLASAQEGRRKPFGRRLGAVKGGD